MIKAKQTQAASNRRAYKKARNQVQYCTHLFDNAHTTTILICIQNTRIDSSHIKFSSSHHPPTVLKLYISLVRSQLMYCTQLWRPYLLKDIDNIERIQRRATKFILRDYASGYRSRLIKLKLLKASSNVLIRATGHSICYQISQDTY